MRDVEIRMSSVAGLSFTRAWNSSNEPSRNSDVPENSASDKSFAQCCVRLQCK